MTCRRHLPSLVWRSLSPGTACCPCFTTGCAAVQHGPACRSIFGTPLLPRSRPAPLAPSCLKPSSPRCATAAGGLTLLKGAAVGHTVYPNPALRPVSDLDLLTPREQVGRVQSRLEAIGYRGVGLTAHRRLGGLARRYRAELPLVGYVPGLGHLLVELHWSLAEIPYYIDLVTPAALAEDAKPLHALPGCSAPRPSVLLAYAAGHLALHHSRDLRLIWLVDLDYLVRSGRVDWDDLLRIAEAWKLGLALHAGLAAVAGWLRTPVDPAIMAELGRLAQDPVGVRLWGLGDEAPDRAWRRAAASLSTLPPASALRYAGWLALRGALRPIEHAASAGAPPAGQARPQ